MRGREAGRKRERERERERSQREEEREERRGEEGGRQSLGEKNSFSLSLSAAPPVRLHDPESSVVFRTEREVRSSVFQ